jgi:hypothetical protein
MTFCTRQHNPGIRLRPAKLASLWVLVLVSMLVSTGEARGGYVDCTTCHLAPTPDSGAKDYSDYFSGGKRAHSVGVDYPPLSNPDYKRPTGVEEGTAFFDTNGNGFIDPDEIQLFGAGDKIECSSCHREHGDGPPPAEPRNYVRLANVSDAMCRACHLL